MKTKRVKEFWEYVWELRNPIFLFVAFIILATGLILNVHPRFKDAAEVFCYVSVAIVILLAMLSRIDGEL